MINPRCLLYGPIAPCTICIKTQMIGVSCRTSMCTAVKSVKSVDVHSSQRGCIFSGQLGRLGVTKASPFVITVRKTCSSLDALSSRRATYNHAKPNPHNPSLYLYNTPAWSGQPFLRHPLQNPFDSPRRLNLDTGPPLAQQPYGTLQSAFRRHTRHNQ